MVYVKVGNRDVEVEDDVVGVLVSETRLRNMELEIVQLRKENGSLRDMISTLKFAHILEAGNIQNIEPLGNFDDYLFSEN